MSLRVASRTASKIATADFAVVGNRNHTDQLGRPLETIG